MTFTSRATTDCVVVGGGPAGMMAAYQAASRGVRVLLLEPNRDLGRKLRITGKGRCNLTNDCQPRDFLKNIPRNPKFITSAINRFSPADVKEFFQSRGVPLKTERGDRVFPVSDRASDIADCLGAAMSGAGVRMKRDRATGLIFEEGVLSGVRAESGVIACSSVIIATGGVSYPLTGSTGDGYALARSAGHQISAPVPSLVPLESMDAICPRLQGLSLRNVTLSACGPDGLAFRELGELLFTHFGVSGPLALSASAHMRGAESGAWRLEIDLKPGLDRQMLDARLLRDFDKYKNRDFANSLDDLFPSKLIPVVVDLSGIPPEEKTNSVTREQRRRLLELIKAFPVSVSGFRPIDEAIVTSGGVCVTEVNPRTMESKLRPGLYFAGEVLDVDGYTGGFNLQIAWSTGFVAGCSVEAENSF